MTWYGSTRCGACSATTTVLVSDSFLSGGTPAADPFDRSGWTRCPDCRKAYCPKHLPDGACDLCRHGSDQPPASPQGVVFDLQFSADECQVIANVLSCVSGDPSRSQRRFSDSVLSKVTRLGFYSQMGNVLHGTLEFEHDRHLKYVAPPGMRVGAK